jgi:DNA-binding response OmpR family regulator
VAGDQDDVITAALISAPERLPATDCTDCCVHGRPRVVRSGPLRVDLKTLEMRLDSVPLSLTATELKILLYLVKRLGHACWHQEILEAVWGTTWRSEHNSHMLRVSMSRLRAKLGGVETGLLATVTGIGYRLEEIQPHGGADDD